MIKTKQEWISEFRNVGEATISDLIISDSNKTLLIGMFIVQMIVILQWSILLDLI